MDTEYINYTLLRSNRNQLLIESDKYILADYPITDENLILIKEYRQQLRNFTLNSYIIPEFPF
jgi:hypothetical protein